MKKIENLFKKEKFENEKKEISKSKDESLFKRSKEISKELDNVSNEQKKIKLDLDKILSIYQIYLIKMFQMEKMKMITLKFLNQVIFKILILNQRHIMN